MAKNTEEQSGRNPRSKEEMATGRLTRMATKLASAKVTVREKALSGDGLCLRAAAAELSVQCSVRAVHLTRAR